MQARHRQHEGLLDLGRQPLGDGGGVVRVGVGEQDAEFVTAEASQYVSIPEHAFQTRPQHLQYLVTYGMPEGVVDLLEMVEVQQQQGEVTGVIGPCGSAREELVEHAQQMTAVAEACQLVAERLQPVGLGQDSQIVKREHESCPSRQQCRGGKTYRNPTDGPCQPAQKHGKPAGGGYTRRHEVRRCVRAPPFHRLGWLPQGQ